MSSSVTTSTLSLLQLLRQRPALGAFIFIRTADELGAQMLFVAVGWYVYEATHDPMSLAYAGLAQFLPTLGMLLFAGHAADLFDRRKIVGVSLLIQALCLGAFAVWLAMTTPSAGPVYVLLLVSGCARAFPSPAMSAMLPHLVSAEEFPRAVAITTSLYPICAIVGPAIGGLIYGVNGPAMFAVAAVMYLIGLTQAHHLVAGRPPEDEKARAQRDKSILAGVHYLRTNRLLLGLISLDLFAVLLGGVSALLPIYAQDILLVGPLGLGVLRGAPGVGAVLVGLVLAHRAIDRQAGTLMLACVAGFGAATLVFAISTDFWLSLIALGLAGGFDMVSMVIRQTLLQVSTPDAMRGRVSAVSSVFIGASNELGEVESGVAAALLGTVPAALLGGIGTLVIVALWTKLFPEIRRADRLVAD
jgi:MFS family permease